MFQLIDVNREHNNCGHYPEWVVVEVETGRGPHKNNGGVFNHRHEAQQEAATKNLKSWNRWKRFLNG